MPLKTLLYLSLFGLAFLGGIFRHPVIGVYAYLATYNINPLGQWWGRFLPSFAERYAMLLALAIALGVLFQHAKLRYGRLLERQEVLLLLFVGVMWLSVLVGQGSGVDYNITKMTKVVLILLMASHVVTTAKQFEGMLWVFILSGLYLGYELYGGGGRFFGGRFHGGIGGSDFGEGNFLAAHFAFILPYVGVMLIKSAWKARAVLLLSAVFIVNSIVMTRSRGTFLALAVGAVFSLLLISGIKQYRKYVVVLIFVGMAGAVFLTDGSFWARMETLQVENVEDRDASAQGRLYAWRGAWEMSKDYPLGVGVGEFFSHIGGYAPEMAGRDAHSTYLRCLSELGFLGFALLMAIICNSFLILRKVEKASSSLEHDRVVNYQLFIYATRLALIIYLTAATFITSTYIEEFYWLLLLPVFLKRALDNEMELFESKKVISLDTSVGQMNGLYP